jgi:hypothetical protein
LHKKTDHIKDANDKLSKYWECRIKDREDKNENLVNKNQKLLKALEAIKVPVSAYIYFFILDFLYSQTPN